MTSDNQLLYRFLAKESFVNNLDCYQFLSTYSVEREIALNKDVVFEKLVERDLNGNIQIEEGIVLPHLKDGHIQKSAVLIINLEQEISQWSEKVNQVDLIIAVFIKEQEEKNVLQEIIQFMRNLAEDEFFEKLKNKKEI